MKPLPTRQPLVGHVIGANPQGATGHGKRRWWWLGDAAVAVAGGWVGNGGLAGR
jgi:hypothetical protein